MKAPYQAQTAVPCSPYRINSLQTKGFFLFLLCAYARCPFLPGQQFTPNYGLSVRYRLTASQAGGPCWHCPHFLSLRLRRDNWQKDSFLQEEPGPRADSVTPSKGNTSQLSRHGQHLSEAFLNFLSHNSHRGRPPPHSQQAVSSLHANTQSWV